jgi:hypothetical protein
VILGVRVQAKRPKLGDIINTDTTSFIMPTPLLTVLMSSLVMLTPQLILLTPPFNRAD